MMEELTLEELIAIRDLKRKGWCVVLFTPTELNDADADHMEDVLIERGWNFLGETNDG